MIALLFQQEHASGGHGVEADVVVRQFGSDRATGLSALEAARRLTIDGPNDLAEAAGRNWAVAWKPEPATMAMTLIAPVMIFAMAGDYIAVAIAAFVGSNFALGFHRLRRQKANLAGKTPAVARVRVRRDGRLREICAREIVVGDLMMIEAGNVIAADGWLLDAENLRIEEAALTGNLRPLVKEPAISPGQAVRANAVVDNRAGKVFMGTTVTSGCGHAVVTATGIRTLIGQSAKMSQIVRPGSSST